jgi:DNA-binding response OmpR family regulator
MHYEVDWAESAESGWNMLKVYKYDLIILDWNLPRMSGVELCKEIRGRGEAMPVIMLTAKGQLDDKEEGLDAGADDYLTKPFEARELQARIRALLRRPTSFAGNQIQIRNIVLDQAAHSVTLDGEPVNLIPREFSLLLFFMKHPGQVFSLEALLERVWSNESDALPSAVRKCVERLRQKLAKEGGPRLIETVFGAGYILRP